MSIHGQWNERSTASNKTMGKKEIEDCIGISIHVTCLSNFPQGALVYKVFEYLQTKIVTNKVCKLH